MNMYKVDDGATHWVIARSEDDALKVWQEQMDNIGVSEEELDLDEPPSVFRMSREEASRTKLFDDYEHVGSMLEDFERNPSRRYMACSEW